MDVLPPSVVDTRLAEGMGWRRDGDVLVKVHTGQLFSDAMAYVNAVADLAEQMDHHPDIDIRWNTVTLRLTTHSAGGITEADFELGRRIDALDASPG